MAEHAGVSASTVGRIWRTFGLQPHVVESFKISDDPLFIEKVRTFVGLYLNPPDHAVVLSFDEKPQIQALERAQPILPMDLGRPERQTHNYIRHGTVDLFAALNVATGQVVAQTKKPHRSRDFVSFLREIDERVHSALTVHVILDNLSAHKSPLVKRWVARHPALPVPLYADLLRLAQPRRAVLWPSHRTRPQARNTFQPARAAPSHLRLRGRPQRRGQTLQVDKDSRRHSREGEAVRTAHRSSPRWPQMTNDFLKKSKIKGTSRLMKERLSWMRGAPEDVS